MAQPLSEEEKKILRAFQRQVDRLRRSTLIQRGNVTFKYTTKITFPSGEANTTFAGYDPVAFQSQLPLLRQFLLQQDTVNFYRIHNIVNKCCDRPELLEWTRLARQRWKNTLARLPVDDHRFFHGAVDNVDTAIEKLFYGYGGLFHADIDKPDEEDDVLDIQKATLQHAFPYFWNSLHTLDSVIHLWLDEPTKPVSPPPNE